MLSNILFHAEEEMPLVVDLPEDLITSIEKCTSAAEVKAVGIEWAIQQSLELKQAGVPVLHYYSMGKSENIRQIAKAVF